MATQTSPRKPFQELTTNGPTIPKPQPGNPSPLLNGTIRGLKAAKAREQLLQLCRQSKPVCQLLEQNLNVTGLAATVSKSAKCVYCNKSFEPTEHLREVCWYHRGKKIVDYDAMEWADRKWGDPEPEEFTNDRIYQNGFKWDCCRGRGNAKGCRRATHTTKAELTASLGKPVSAKRKADSKPQEPKKKPMVVHVGVLEEEEKKKEGEVVARTEMALGGREEIFFRYDQAMKLANQKAAEEKAAKARARKEQELQRQNQWYIDNNYDQCTRCGGRFSTAEVKAKTEACFFHPGSGVDKTWSCCGQKFNTFGCSNPILKVHDLKKMT